MLHIVFFYVMFMLIYVTINIIVINKNLTICKKCREILQIIIQNKENAFCESEYPQGLELNIK